jgi:hypothetical protein
MVGALPRRAAYLRSFVKRFLAAEPTDVRGTSAFGRSARTSRRPRQWSLRARPTGASSSDSRRPTGSRFARCVRTGESPGESRRWHDGRAGGPVHPGVRGTGAALIEQERPRYFGLRPARALRRSRRAPL